MKNLPKPRDRALRLYGWVLRLYPQAHRRAFGGLMLQTFGDCYRETVERGGSSETRFWLGVLSDESRSLVREHLATLGERGQFVKSVLPVIGKAAGGVLALLFWVLVMDVFFPVPASVPPYAWLLATLIYAVALLAVYYLVRSLPRRDDASSSWRSSWWRLGLVLGALAGLDLLLLNVAYVLTSSGPGQALDELLLMGSNLNKVFAVLYLIASLGPLWALSLPLLAGAIGILGAYGSGRLRTGLAAGALAGGTMLAIQLVSLVLLTLGKNALSPTTPMTGLPGATSIAGIPVLSSSPGFMSIAGFPLTVLALALLIVLIWPTPLVVGSVLGARAARISGRATAGDAHSARVLSRPVRAVRWIGLGLLLAILGPVLWLGLVVAQILETHINVYGNILAPLAYINQLYIILPNAAWLLTVVTTLVAALVMLRPATRPPQAASSDR